MQPKLIPVGLKDGRLPALVHPVNEAGYRRHHRGRRSIGLFARMGVGLDRCPNRFGPKVNHTWSRLRTIWRRSHGASSTGFVIGDADSACTHCGYCLGRRTGWQRDATSATHDRVCPEVSTRICQRRGCQSLETMNSRIWRRHSTKRWTELHVPSPLSRGP